MCTHSPADAALVARSTHHDRAGSQRSTIAVACEPQQPATSRWQKLHHAASSITRQLVIVLLIAANARMRRLTETTEMTSPHALVSFDNFYSKCMTSSPKLSRSGCCRELQVGATHPHRYMHPTRQPAPFSTLLIALINAADCAVQRDGRTRCQ